MKLVFLNGSPRADQRSNSKKMIDYFASLLNQNFESLLELNALKLFRQKKFEDSFTQLLEADVLIISAPLYVDSLPSALLDYLYQLECFTKTNPQLVTHPIKVYGCVNCGFLGGEQNHIALEILENFSNHLHFKWCGGIGIGSGEMLGATLNSVPKTAKVQAPVYEGLDHFIDAIKKGAVINTQHHQLLVTQNFSFFLFTFMLNMNWLAGSKFKFHKIYAKPYAR